MDDLKLLAVDSEDLAVISAHVQDAVVRVPDMGYVKSEQRFAFLMNRYAWEADGRRRRGARKRAAMHFNRVLEVKVTGINLKSEEGVLELLSVTFEAVDAPAGMVELAFAGGGTIRLTGECLEARLKDLGAAWGARKRPLHDLTEKA
jgi:hypothetical protein